MSKFNTVAPTSKTINLSGGSAFKESAELELTSAVLTSFLDDKAYQTGDNRQKQIVDLIDKVDLKFVANLALYARKEYGMRSVSHLLAGEIAIRVAKAKDNSWGRPCGLLSIGLGLKTPLGQNAIRRRLSLSWPNVRNS